MRFSSASAQSTCTNATLCHFGGTAARLRLNGLLLKECRSGPQNTSLVFCEDSLPGWPFPSRALALQEKPVGIVSALTQSELPIGDPQSSPSPGFITSISAGLEPVNRKQLALRMSRSLGNRSQGFQATLPYKPQGNTHQGCFSICRATGYQCPLPRV